MPGTLLIISGPSGVGKTTICRRLVEELGAFLSVSLTTRPKRPGEVEGQAYHFISPEHFRRQLEKGEFLEYAQVYSGHYYGTPAGPVHEALARGRVAILEIDIAGTVQVKRLFPDAISIYILPPTDEDLQFRIRGRRQDTEQAIQERLSKAQSEIQQAHASGAYNRFVVNQDVEDTVRQIIQWVRESGRASPNSTENDVP